MAALSVIALFYTYSRSAYLGLIASLGSLFYLIKLDKKWRKQFAFVCIVGLTLLGLIFVSIRHNSVAENVLFHTSNSSKAKTSSNSQRAGALETGLKQVIHEPLGEGPGTAGPASVHNNHPARIAENYYIQVAQETGWVGVTIFIAINVLLALELWRRQADPLASLLLASLIGISIVNMLSHAWADDTLSLLWWGMAGIALTPAIIKDRVK